MRCLIAVVIVSLSTVTLHAGLGQSVADCKTSFGEVIVDNPATAKYPYRTVKFKKDSLLIVVDFKDDKAEMISVLNSDYSKISPQEMETWLNADPERGKWTQMPDSPNRWTRANGDQATLVEPSGNGALPHSEISILTYYARMYLLSLLSEAKR